MLTLEIMKSIIFVKTNLQADYNFHESENWWHHLFITANVLKTNFQHLLTMFKVSIKFNMNVWSGHIYHLLQYIRSFAFNIVMPCFDGHQTGWVLLMIQLHRWNPIDPFSAAGKFMLYFSCMLIFSLRAIISKSFPCIITP